MSNNYLSNRTLSLAAAALLSAAAASGSALAQTATPDDQAYKLYHQAIYAASYCQGRNLYQDSAYNQNWNGDSARAAQSAQARLAEVIGAKTGHGTRSTNQLTLIDEAKAEARTLIAQEGCQGSNVESLIGLFESDLAPAL